MVVGYRIAAEYMENTGSRTRPDDKIIQGDDFVIPEVSPRPFENTYTEEQYGKQRK